MGQEDQRAGGPGVRRVADQEDQWAVDPGVRRVADQEDQWVVGPGVRRAVGQEDQRAGGQKVLDAMPTGVGPRPQVQDWPLGRRTVVPLAWTGWLLRD